MKRISILFLQSVLVLIAVGALAFLLVEPHLEGRNVNATLLQIYFNDPLLACAYVASTAFFAALYQAFRLLGYIRKNEVFSLNSVKALRTIKYCALVLAGFLLAGEAYLFLAVRGEDDIAGGVVLGLAMLFVSLVTATAAAIAQRLLQTAVELKSENDLTV